MMRSASGLLIILLSLLFLASCATAPAEPSVPSLSQADLTNRLTARGKTLKLPSDWVFVPNSLDKGTVCNFRGPHDIRGGLECLEFSYDLNHENLIGFYEEHAFNSDKKTVTEVLEHERLGQVVIFSGVSEKKEPMLSLLRADGNKATILFFTYPKKTLFSKDDALIILENFIWEDRSWLYVRNRKGFPLFSSFDNTWFWYGDFRDGYYLGLNGSETSEDILTGLWTVSESDMEELKSAEEISSEPFVHVMNISNIPVEMTVYRTVSDGLIMKLHAFFIWENIPYCFYLSRNAGDLDNKPEKLMNLPEVQDLFDFHLLFDEIEL